MGEPRGIIEGYTPRRIPGVECDLYKEDGTKVKTLISNKYGYYKFDHLESGTYVLKFFGGGLSERDWIYDIPVIGNVESDIDKIPPVDFKDTSDLIELEPGVISVLASGTYNVIGNGTYFERYVVGGKIQIVASRYNDGEYTISAINGNEEMAVSHTFTTPETDIVFSYTAP